MSDKDRFDFNMSRTPLSPIVDLFFFCNKIVVGSPMLDGKVVAEIQTMKESLGHIINNELNIDICSGEIVPFNVNSDHLKKILEKGTIKL